MTVLDVGDLRAALKVGLDEFRDEEDAHRKLQQWIDAQYARIELPANVASSRIIRRGIVEQEICDEIRDSAPQLVIMGSAGLARRIPIGSRTEYVIRHGGVPVVVVPLKARGERTSGPQSPDLRPGD